MTRIFALLSIAFLASGCRDPKPSANLDYAKVYQTPSTFVVEFKSDLNFKELYATNKNEEIIVKKLVCALGDDKNFEVEHKMRYVFRGDLELQGTSKVGETGAYRYFSHGDFYENPPESSDLKRLTGKALAGILGNKKSVPCKVIMTIYLSSPYYSGAMLIPAEDILRASNSPK